MGNTFPSSIVLALLLTACGGPAQESTADTSDTSETPATTGAEQQLAWADMNHEQRGQYMHDVVLPRMGELFRGYDAERFADFNCNTCHGENAREVNLHMPNGIHPLDPAQLPAMFESEDPAVQRAVAFMSGPVEHTMAELLQMEPYDAETQQGFGCFNCHGTASAE